MGSFTEITGRFTVRSGLKLWEYDRNCGKFCSQILVSFTVNQDSNPSKFHS